MWSREPESSIESDEIRVLCVDDEAEFAELTRTFLERIDDRIVGVAETAPTEAVDRLCEDPFDCVVSDYEMPELNGLELLDAVRSAYPDLPFVLFTGRGSEEIASEAISAGVTDYVQKRPGRDGYEMLANRVQNAVRQRHAEQALAESRRRLSTLIGNLPGIAYRCRNERTWPMEFVSRGCLDLTGYAPDAFLDGAVSWGTDVIHPDDRDDVWERMQSALGRRESFEITYRIRTREGEQRWVREQGEYVGEENGTAMVEGLISDVTEQVEDERRLQRHAETIENLHRAAADLASAHTESEVYERAVRVAEGVLSFDICVIDGVEDGKLIGRAESGQVPEDGSRDVALEEGGLGAHTYRTGESALVDEIEAHPHATPVGEYRSVISVPIAEDGIFQAAARERCAFDEYDLELAELLVSHVRAAVERVRSATELRNERDRRAALFENASDPIAEVVHRDHQPMILDVNERFEETFGYDADDVRGENLDELIVPADERDEADRINRRAETGSVETRAHRQTTDGLREFLIRSIRIDGLDGIRGYAVYTDVPDETP